MSSSQPATCSCLFSLTSQGDDPFLLIEMSMGRCELREKLTTQSLLLLPFFPHWFPVFPFLWVQQFTFYNN